MPGLYHCYSTYLNAERDPDYAGTVAETLGSKQKIILMCAIGGSLVSKLYLRRDKVSGDQRYIWSQPCPLLLTPAPLPTCLTCLIISVPEAEPSDYSICTCVTCLKYPDGIEDPDRNFGRESRCLKAAFELMNAGWTDRNLLYVDGGFQQWKFQGLPLESGFEEE